jgi:hypothetical protein
LFKHKRVVLTRKKKRKIIQLKKMAECKQVRVSIIGSAGRGNDFNKLNNEMYIAAIQETKRIIIDEFKLIPNQVILVSGMAAVADHIAVKLYLEKNQSEWAGLELHAPAHFDVLKYQFHDNGEKTSQKNPGARANQLHRQFSKIVKPPSLMDLTRLVKASNSITSNNKTIRIMYYKGFKQRNNAVATSNYIIALTFSDTDAPCSESGTWDTWQKADPTVTVLRHVQLHKLVREKSVEDSKHQS